MADRALNLNLAMRLTGTLSALFPFDKQQSLADFRAAWASTIANGDGSVENEGNVFWSMERFRLRGGTSKTIDLYDLGTMDIGLGAGKDPVGLSVACRNAVLLVIRLVDGPGLAIGGEGSTAAWSAPFGSDTGAFTIGRGGVAVLKTAGLAPYAVADATNHLLKIAAQGNDVSIFDIYFVGQEEENSSSSSSSSSTSSSSSNSSSQSSSSSVNSSSSSSSVSSSSSSSYSSSSSSSSSQNSSSSSS